MKYLSFLILLICPMSWAANFPISSGASTATIQSTINSAAAASGGNTVTFAAGSYSITSQISIPCPTSALTIQGPTLSSTTWPPVPTAILTNNGITNNWGFVGHQCSVGVTFQYLEWNGNQPSGGGGGFLHIVLGMNNTVVQWNYIHGNMALQTSEQRPDLFVYLDGGYSSTHTQNTTIQFNKFGNTGSGDCGGAATSATGKGLMTLMGSGGGNGTCYSTSPSGYAPPSGASNSAHTCLYQGQPNLNGGGGACGAFGLAVNTDNFSFLNNSVQEQEQGGKCYKPGTGNVTSTNTLLQYNDFSGIHRIGYEAQCNDGLTTVDSNDWHDPYFPDANSWSLSVPQGNTASTNNLLIANTTPVNDRNGNPPSGAGNAIEFWGPLTSSNNLIQGQYNGGILWGFNSGSPSINNNIFQMTSSTQFISQEQNATPPSQSGNVTGSIVSARASVIPTISPTPTGTYSTPIAVTITDNGYTTGVGPHGNHSIFYTTNGTNPTTSSTWCASPCSIMVSPGTTVNAIGMWGAINQPRSYASTFGFVPSSIVSAHYSSGSTPTLTGVTVSLQGGGSSVPVSNTVQACANTAYTGGSVGQVCGSGNDLFGTTIGTWTSSTSNATITTNGGISGVSAGSSNITAKATQGATNFTSPNFALTVTPIAPTLTGIIVKCPATIQQGQSGNCTATCTYTGPQQTNCTTTDSFGNVASGWASSAPTFATVSGPAVTGVAVGSSTISASVGSFSNGALVQITSSGPPPATLTSVTIAPSSSSVIVGSTINFTATCTYSDLSTTNCTTTDPHGNAAGSWNSTVTVDATINSTTGVLTGVAIGSTNVTAVAGTFSSNSVTVPVTAPPGISVLGDSATDTAGNTSTSFINATYAVAGTNTAGYKVQSCTFYLPTGTLHVAGSKWDCGLIPAPSASTQSPNWLCWSTYTTTGTTSDYGWHSLSLPTCGVLPPSSAYWVGVVTNEPGRPGQGFSTCGGGACNGAVPTVGIGTYPYRFISATYGVYVGMGTAMNATTQPGLQSSQYVTLATPSATLIGGFLANPGPTITISVGGAVQFSGYCSYSDGTQNICYPTPDQYGNTITAFSSDNTGVVTIGNIGSAHPGLATGVAAGTANIKGTLTGGVSTSPAWGLIVSSVPLPYPPSTVKVLSR